MFVDKRPGITIERVRDWKRMPRCLIVAAPHKVGHTRQAIAVAQRLGRDAIIRPSHDPELGRGAIEADVVLAAGRESIGPARRIVRQRNASGATLPIVAVLQPVVWRSGAFDLIWAPAHDRHPLGLGRSANRIETLTAPSAIDTGTMAAALEAVATMAAFAAPAVRAVGVLLGGPSRAYRFDVPEADELASRLSAFAETHDVRLLLSASRRTPAVVVRRLAERLGSRHTVFDPSRDWGVDTSTIHAAILGRCEAFVVTADSVAMLSEACATGRPVFAWPLPGGRAKFDRFHAGLIAAGAMRWFDGNDARWTYPPLDAAQVIARALEERLGLLADAPHRI